VSISSKVILQISHRCCSMFLEVDADADIEVIIYVAIIVKVCEYMYGINLVKELCCNSPGE
jgi:ubiquinone biosynthesis protein UbiJ